MKCYRCDKDVRVWNPIKKNAWCGPCINMLKEYFEMKNDTKGKDIRQCRCCRMYGEIKYTDGYRIQICLECLEKYAPQLRLQQQLPLIKNGNTKII